MTNISLNGQASGVPPPPENIHTLFEQLLHVRVIGVCGVSLLLRNGGEGDVDLHEQVLEHRKLTQFVVRGPQQLLIDREAFTPYHQWMGDERFGMVVTYLIEPTDTHIQAYGRQVFPKCVWRDPGEQYTQVEVHAHLSETDADGVEIPLSRGGKAYSYMEFVPIPADVLVVHTIAMLGGSGGMFPSADSGVGGGHA